MSKHKPNEKRTFKFTDPNECAERVKVALGAHDLYRHHLILLESATIASKANPYLAAKIKRHVAEKTFEAEKQLRKLLGVSLTQLNELRDSGVLYDALMQCTEIFSDEKGNPNFAAPFSRAAKQVKAENVDLNNGIIEESIELLQKHIKKITSGKEEQFLTVMWGDKERILVIEPKPRPGHLGRIGLQEFFDPMAADGWGIASSPVTTRDTCHHLENQTEHNKASEKQIVDIYGACVTSLAYSRESMYIRARRVSEVGLGEFEGRDPLTIMGIIFIVAGTAMLVVGVAYEIIELIVLGILCLLVGGALVIGAQCAFVPIPIAVPVVPEPFEWPDMPIDPETGEP